MTQNTRHSLLVVICEVSRSGPPLPSIHCPSKELSHATGTVKDARHCTYGRVTMFTLSNIFERGSLFFLNRLHQSESDKNLHNFNISSFFNTYDDEMEPNQRMVHEVTK